MSDFVHAVAAWWQTRNLYLDFDRPAHRRPRESDVTRAMAHVWKMSTHVDADDPLLRAVKAWADFDAAQVNHGAAPDSWRRRKQLTETLLDAINAAVDRDLEGGVL